MTKRKHLSSLERDKIAILLNQNISVRKIACTLNRHHSTIDAEIKKNKGPDGKYYPSEAHSKARTRKSKASQNNARKDGRIWRYVKDKLVAGWLPEQISSCMKKDIGEYACTETIYNFIYSKENKHLTLWVHLRRGKKRKEPERTAGRLRKKS